MSEKMTEAEIREAVGRAVLNFRARSATTAYTNGHALQPSDVVRLTEAVTAALVAARAEQTR